MKVIRDNSIPEWTINTNCKTRWCNSDLEINKEDIYTNMFGAMGDYDREYFVVCPVCKNMVFVTRIIPGDVKSYVLTKRGIE